MCWRLAQMVLSIIVIAAYSAWNARAYVQRKALATDTAWKRGSKMVKVTKYLYGSGAALVAAAPRAQQAAQNCSGVCGGCAGGCVYGLALAGGVLALYCLKRLAENKVCHEK